MHIPEAVLDKAKELIDIYGNKIRYLGKCDNKDVFKFQFPENERTGFPYVYLYDKQLNTVEEVTGKNAIKIIRRCL